MFSFKLEDYDPLKRLLPALSAAQYALDNQVLKDSNLYVPVDQWYLYRSGIIFSSLGEGRIAWQTPYARRLYYNPQYNFSTDLNMRARGMWFEAAKAEHKKEWIDISVKAAKSML